MEREVYFGIIDNLNFVTENFIDHRDPDVFLLSAFAENLKALYEYLYQCYLSYRGQQYVFIEDDDITEDDFSSIMKRVRDELWFKIVENYDFIYEPINCYKYNEKIRITDLIFLCISICNICLSYRLIMYDDDLRRLAPTDIDYARSSGIVKTETPITAMSVFELVDSLRQISYNWNKLYYHQDLIKYTDLLEFRASMILNETDDQFVHDVANYRREIDKENNVYAYNQTLLNIISSYLIGFRIRVTNRLVAEHVQCPKEYAPEEHKCTSLLNWLKKSAKSSFGDFIYTQFRMKYLKLIIRPGEREEYIRKKPSDVVTEQKIYRCVRGDEAANQILEFSSNREAYDMLDDDEHEYPNSRPTIAYILLDKVFGGIFNMTLGRYVIFRDEIRYRHMELQYEENPMLIQTFNRFNVFYRGQVYVINDFIKSFVTFMNILEKNHNASIENGQLDASFLYAEFFHKNYFNDVSNNYNESSNNNQSNNARKLYFDDEHEYEIGEFDDIESEPEAIVTSSRTYDNNNNIEDEIEIVL